MKKYNYKKIVAIIVLFSLCTLLFIFTLLSWHQEGVITTGSVLSAIVIDYGVIALIGGMGKLFKIRNHV